MINLMSRNGFAPIVIIFLIALGIGFFVYSNRSKINIIPSQKGLTEESQEPQAPLSPEEYQQKNILESFLDDDPNWANNNIGHYPDFKNKVQKDQIRKAYNIKLRSNLNPELDENFSGIGSGWVIEIEKEENLFTYYLLTKNLQQELTNVMSGNADDKGTYCKVEKIQQVGNEASLGRILTDKNGYLVLTGGCLGYGGGNFVSIFKITTGEKIAMKGNFTQKGSNYEGVSPSGSALGKLRGVYGINNPTIIVEYGYSAVDPIEEVNQLAFFDLQTGQLNQLIKFQ
jgi:hypothetical protein